MKKIFIAVLHKEEKGFSVWIPDVPGCNSEGDDVYEAINNIKSALSLYFADALATSREIPSPLSTIKDIELKENEFAAIIEFDFLRYIDETEKGVVKKTLTIPRWLDTLAKENHVAFSSLLTEALLKKFELI